MLVRGDERREIVALARTPITFGGAARHNVANALAAVAMAIDASASRPRRWPRGCGGSGHEPEDNPGRAKLFDWDGVRVLLDYAHNPHGMSALVGWPKDFRPSAG